MANGTRRCVRACLITNPWSGRRGLDLSEALVLLRANGWDVTVRQKRHGGEATELARCAAVAGCNVVVGCGGDGTLSEIVDGLAGTDVAVGVIPGGTVNLWAKEIGVSRSPRIAALQLLTAERRRADLGHIAINGRHSRHFLLMAGIGFDGAVMQRVSKPLKQQIGPLAVGYAALQALSAFQASPVTVEIDGVAWQGNVVQIVAGNTRKYGGFTAVTPAARIDDGRLDLCLFTASSALSLGRQAISIVARGRPNGHGSEEYRAARIRIRSEAVLPVQLDGGRVSLTHVVAGPDGVTYDISARPGTIELLVPATYDGDLFEQHFASTAATRVRLRHLDEAHGRHADACLEREPNRETTHDEQHRVRVTSTGAGSISGVRWKSGRPITVELAPEAAAKDVTGDRVPTDTFLSMLAEGDVVRVRGTKGSERGVFVARRLRLLGPEATEP